MQKVKLYAIKWFRVCLLFLPMIPVEREVVYERYVCTVITYVFRGLTPSEPQPLDQATQLT